MSKEIIDEFSEALYVALLDPEEEDYPTNEALMKSGLGVLHHSRHTVEEMKEIIKAIVKRTLYTHKLKIERKSITK